MNAAVSRSTIPISSAILPSRGQGTHATWCYNWDSATSNYDAWLKYVPMLHSLREEHMEPWIARAHQASRLDGDDPTYLLGFNEPDNCDGGTCISTQDAVSGWKNRIDPLRTIKAKMYFESPAVTNAEQKGMGLDWLSQFMDACIGYKIDFINIHWYGGADRHEEFKEHIDDARKIAQGRPIWVTEFKPSGTDEEIMDSLDEVLLWTDEVTDIHRYACSMARPGRGLLIDDAQTNMSNIGAYYNFHHKEIDVGKAQYS